MSQLRGDFTRIGAESPSAEKGRIFIPADAPTNSQPEQYAYERLSTLPAGALIGNRYQIERLVGKGGFGIVFAAFDTTLGSRVALKFLDPELISERAKFVRVRREVTLARRIGDEHLVKVFSLEDWRGLSFLVMEYVEGRSLRQFLNERGKIPWGELWPIVEQLLEGVAVLHRHAIVHRDLKPSNVMLGEDGRVKVLDFGLAKEVADQEKTSTVGEVVGSPFFLSPEQVRGEEVDARSDVYQLGLVLYCALSGRHPFHESTAVEVLLRQLHDRPPPLRAAGSGLPTFVAQAVATALEKNPTARFRDARQMLAFLQRKRVSPLRKLGVALHRRPLWATLGIGLLALGLWGAWGATIGSRQLHHVDFTGTVLRGQNRLGRTLWRRDFAPFTVAQAWATPNRKGAFFPYRDQTQAPSHQLLPGQYTWVLLSHPSLLEFPPLTSIGDTKHDNLIGALDPQGRMLFRNEFTTFIGGQTYDFFNAFDLGNIQIQLEKDPNAESEATLTLTQAHSFFPCSFVFLHGMAAHIFTNPGNVNFWQRLHGDGSAIRFLLSGTNNLVAHLGFIAELQFAGDRPVEHILGIPTFSEGSIFNLTGPLFFVPKECQVKENHWDQDGTAVLENPRQGETLIVGRNGDLVVTGAGGRRVFHDPPERLRRIYALIQTGFQNSVLLGNLDKGLSEIKMAAREPLTNPYLKSALLTLRGTLEMRTGNLAGAETTLTEALGLHPDNTDAAQKLCEIGFLRGEPLKASQRLKRQFESFAKFWGLGPEGNQMFQIECLLQAGQFAEAQAVTIKLSDSFSGRTGNVLKAVISMFTGDYPATGRLLAGGERGPFAPFEFAEYRLFYGRALTLADREPGKARFFFNDLVKHSLTRRHLAEISALYYQALAGDAKGAAELARPAFVRLEKTARGDFDTRLWLFYDAYIYGRIMELAGNRAESLRGYRACVAANPHTALAGKAREKLRW